MRANLVPLGGNDDCDGPDDGFALLAKARGLGADRLVIGGYGHSRMRELIFSGVMLHVLSQHDLPVLVAH